MGGLLPPANLRLRRGGHPTESPWAPTPWSVEPDGEEVRIVDRDGKAIGWLDCVRGNWPFSAARIVRAVNRGILA
jgi:hypothetical protein